MSARTDLVAALTEALDDTYRVVGAPDTPDQVEAGTTAVRVYATTVAPGPQSGSLAIDLTVWVLTAVARAGDADDALDEALADVLGVLHDLPWTTAPTAERDVMADQWNGWRLTLQAFGRIERNTP